jgi:hypothetical protein
MGRGYSVTQDADLDLVMELFRGIRGEEPDRARFERLYSVNPLGPARVWVLRDPDGRAIGFTAGYPREMWVDGRICRALNCGDFSVAAEHRTLGPALTLRRPAKALVDSGEFAFLYAHPLPAMLPIHARVGHRQLGEMTRWVHPIRIERALEGRLGLSRVVGLLANNVLRVRRWLRHPAGGGIAVSEAGTFCEEYDVLDRALAAEHVVIGRRDRAYLTWRFSSGERKVTVLEGRDRSGELAGYVVLEVGRPTSRVRDLACLRDRGAARALLLEAVQRAAAAGSDVVDVQALAGFPLAPRLRRIGFWERGSGGTVVCYGGEAFWGKSLVEDPGRWFMTLGDRDV